MLRFDLSTTGRDGHLTRCLNNILSPHGPFGLGNEILEFADMSLPENYSDDFPTYCKMFGDLQREKLKLNEVKSKLTAVNADPHLARLYIKVADHARAYYTLREPGNGLLLKDYDAEIVTNAWLKIYEVMRLVLPPRGVGVAGVAAAMPLKSAKVKPLKSFRSFHMAEAPGAFMLAINHYLATHFPQCAWEWYANSYREIYGGGRNIYLGDKYGIMRKFPDRWLYGADGDGDITSVANLRAFRQHLELDGGLVDFVTSDVKYVPSTDGAAADIDRQFNEEEMVNIPVHLGHLLGSMLCLRPGGSMLLKEFTQFETPSVSLLFLGALCFKKFEIVKPATSRAANSEIYVLGLDYITPNFELINKLLIVMEYIRELNTTAGSPALFETQCIPKSFLDKLVAIERTLTDHQIEHIERNLAMVERLKTMSEEQVSGALLAERNTDAAKKQLADWLEENKIIKLPITRKMVVAVR